MTDGSHLPDVLPALLRRRPPVTIAAAAVVALLASALALRAPAPTYPTGDHAVLELYTLYASETLWPVGPYSRFVWHHPGPLFIYWELPWYLASGRQTLGMAAGALALSVVSLGGLLALLVRVTPAAVGTSAALALGAYTLRLHTLSTDYWNPLVVVLPMTLLVVLGAGLACRRWRQMPWFMLVASFLVQTHVSVVPCVVAVTALALLMAWRGRTAEDARIGGLRRALVVTALVLGTAWALPVLDSLRHWPGNLGTLVMFFVEPVALVPWSIAVASSSRLVTAMFRPGLAIPGGDVHLAAPEALTVLSAALQVVWLAAVAWRARRDRQFPLAALAMLGVTVVLVALASLTRVRGPVGDYLTFWLSSVAVLNWSVCLGGTIAIYTGSKTTIGDRGMRIARATAVAIVALVAGDGIRHLAGTARDYLEPVATARHTRDLTDAVEARVRADGAAHPQFRIAGGVWPEGAGVVLQLRKRGLPVTVVGDVDFVFAAMPTGHEDALFWFTDERGAAVLGSSVTTVARAGRVVVVTPRQHVR